MIQMTRQFHANKLQWIVSIVFVFRSNTVSVQWQKRPKRLELILLHRETKICAIAMSIEGVVASASCLMYPSIQIETPKSSQIEFISRFFFNVVRGGWSFCLNWNRKSYFETENASGSS